MRAALRDRPPHARAAPALPGRPLPCPAGGTAITPDRSPPPSPLPALSGADSGPGSAPAVAAAAATSLGAPAGREPALRSARAGGRGTPAEPVARPHSGSFPSSSSRSAQRGGGRAGSGQGSRAPALRGSSPPGRGKWLLEPRQRGGCNGPSPSPAGNRSRDNNRFPIPSEKTLACVKGPPKHE